MPGFVWLSDKTGGLLFVNRSWTGYTGLAESDSLGHGWLEAVHPEDVAELRALIGARPAGHRRIDLKVRFRNRDGAYRWHLVQARPLDGPDGTWLGCTNDIDTLVATQQRYETQLRVLEMVATGKGIDAVLMALCEFADMQIGGARSLISLVGAGGCAAPGLPPAFAQRAARLLAGLHGGNRAESATNEFLVTFPLSAPAWSPLRDEARNAALRACWSRPVPGAHGATAAVLGFFLGEERGPDSGETELIDSLYHLVTIAVEHYEIGNALRESEEHYRHAVELNPQIPWTADPSGQVLSVSSRWSAETGITEADAVGHGWLGALHPEDVPGVIAEWRRHLDSGEPIDIEYRIRLADGTFRWVRARGAPRRDEHGDIIRWYGTLEDVHRHRLALEKLRRAAYEDELTRLANRRRFEELLREIMERSDAFERKPVGVIMFDLADFKLLNDRFGYRTGDAVLRMAARILSRHARKNEAVARLGADEFAVLVEDISSERELLERAGMMEAALVEGFRRSARSRMVYANIGCAFGESGKRGEDLIKEATLALAHAKKKRRNQIQLFNLDLRTAGQVRTHQVELARRAAQSGWIVPHYQPKVSLETGRIVGLEALMRIAHPDEGLLAPSAFMAAIDDPRTSSQLGTRMLELVVEDLRRWMGSGTAPGHVAVNVSTAVLIEPGFAARVAEMLERASLDCSMLKVEVTERVLVDDLGDEVQASLRLLDEAGIAVSLDDFGTGYASLTHLRRFPISEIKIDRSFVQHLTHDEGDAVIVRAMVNMGRNLGMTVVAEGVETAVQAAALRSLGCQIGQGHHFGKPAPADEVTAARHAADMPGTSKQESERRASKG